MKPTIAVTLGDPCGIGPELTARLLADQGTLDKANVVVVGDRRVLDEGARIAKVPLPAGTIVERGDQLDQPWSGLAILDSVKLDGTSLNVATVSKVAGEWQLACLDRAAKLCLERRAGGLCFAPLNKEAMHRGGLKHEDEQPFIADSLGYAGPMGILNTLGDLWTSRVTSHVALKDVSGMLTVEAVLAAIRLVDATLKAAGYDAPRLAVCGFNPHAGDGGNFGREEIDVIAPAVKTAQTDGINVEGPFPADTIFIKGRAGTYQAIVTMFHDQGQIAMKLMGFEHGVTVHAGLPYPVTTSAHGSAFDIAGQGIANASALLHAFDVACEMASRSKRA